MERNDITWRCTLHGAGRLQSPRERRRLPRVLDEDGQVVADASSGLYFDSTVFPLEHVETEADLQDLSFPVITEEEICFIEEECRTLYETTDRAILFAFGGNILEAGGGHVRIRKVF